MVELFSVIDKAYPLGMHDSLREVYSRIIDFGAGINKAVYIGAGILPIMTGRLSGHGEDSGFRDQRDDQLPFPCVSFMWKLPANCRQLWRQRACLEIYAFSTCSVWDTSKHFEFTRLSATWREDADECTGLGSQQYFLILFLTQSKSSGIEIKSVHLLAY
jgi:hypothetical protein